MLEYLVCCNSEPSQLFQAPSGRIESRNRKSEVLELQIDDFAVCESIDGQAPLAYDSTTMRALLFTILVGFLLLTPASSATTCILVPVKPIRHVCGTVINELGEPIPNATVTILSGEASVASVQTNNDGKFSFEQLKAGSYSIRIQAEYYHSVKSPINIVKPETKCKRALEVMLTVGTACSSIGQTKPSRKAKS